MKLNIKILICIALVAFLSSCNSEKYHLVKDNLYEDSDGKLYIKSEAKTGAMTVKDTMINAVFCKPCPEGKDGKLVVDARLEDYVDKASFKFVYADSISNFARYEDQNYVFIHTFMSDGGIVGVRPK